MITVFHDVPEDFKELEERRLAERRIMTIKSSRRRTPWGESPERIRKRNHQTFYCSNDSLVVEATGLDSRANCALGLPRSWTSTGSPLCAVSPSSPLFNKAKEDIPRGYIFFHLVEATGLEPTISSTRSRKNSFF